MELKQHILYLRKYWLFVLVIGIVTGIAAWIISSNRPPSYNVVHSFEISLANRPATQDYQYGSYYDLKGAEIFTQHVMSLLRDPAVITEIYNEAGVPFEITNLSRFTSQFRTDQGSSQLFTVNYSRYHRDEAEKLAQAMQTVLKKHVVKAAVDDQATGLFALQANDPIILYHESNPSLATLIGVIAGWLSAIILVYSKRYLAES